MAQYLNSNLHRESASNATMSVVTDGHDDDAAHPHHDDEAEEAEEEGWEELWVHGCKDHKGVGFSQC